MKSLKILLFFALLIANQLTAKAIDKSLLYDDSWGFYQSYYYSNLYFSNKEKQELLDANEFLNNTDFNTRVFLNFFTSNLNTFEGFVLKGFKKDANDPYESSTLARLEFYGFLLSLKQGGEIQTEDLIRFFKIDNEFYSRSLVTCERYGIDSEIPELERQIRISDTLDAELKKTLRDVRSPENFTSVESRYFYVIDSFRNYVKEYIPLKEDKYYDVFTEFERYWYGIHAMKFQPPIFIKENYGEISLLDKASLLFEDEYTLIKFDFEALPAPYKYKIMHDEYLNFFNLVFPISDSHKAIYKKSITALKDLEYKYDTALEKGLLNSEELFYFSAGDYFHQKRDDLLESDESPNCIDVRELVDDIKIANEITRISIRNLIRIDGFINEIDLHKKSISMQRELPSFTERYNDGLKDSLALGSGFHGDTKYIKVYEKLLKEEKVKDLDLIQTTLSHLKYTLEALTSIQLKEETIQLFGKNVKGEIIQLGIFAYFRSLDSKNYAYFYNSKWESLENFHDKIDEAFDLLKKDYKNRNSDSHTRVNSLVLPVLEEQFNKVYPDEKNTRRINQALDLDYRFRKNILTSIKREYCNNLSLKARKMYDHYVSNRYHLPATNKDKKYFGSVDILRITAMIDIYSAYWKEEGFIRSSSFAFDVELACMKN